MGLVFSTVMFAVAAAFALAHLVGDLAFTFRLATKPRAPSRTDGVWDRELDHG
ncbi:MAG: hypothetical protein ACLQIB_25375 [Isosphaeraceae bacterium]